MLNSAWRRIVIKVGSALISPDAKGCSTRYLLAIARFISECRQQGTEVVLVSSGSVAAGRSAIAFAHQPLPINIKQAMAAVGQTQMMAIWSHLFDFRCGQILLTHDDLADRRRYLNIDNTLRTLLANKVLPIVNENDSVATAELKVGDNDNLAAMVAILVDADALIICSDIDGLYSANPRTTPDARFIARVDRIDATIYAMAGGSHHSIGTGGMLTKIQAAEKATRLGVDTLIINGQNAAGFDALLRGEQAGTLFVRQQDRLSAKKHWLLNSLKSQGSITLDSGAVQALLHKGASLLAKGITAVSGQFDKGDAIWLCDQSGTQLAKGICQYSATELLLIKGLHSTQIALTLGFCPSEEVVHRDDIALTS
ncbi:MAG: glutamate 5-kinase [Gammaproteobacteria bacterium]|nr:glutamate 5-kinase [Gammaproteobacteria bacterium]MBU1553868.1 glutamate 5-kinase [Gammaproteobacteria bacterium]MBU2069450.1 glutamate 5-kinase [Gammaproteobacteria bacterium]MBU2182954.1 glutamate 5-kinase [Gammaproteobacteria bacterium]MBU2203302.1 glutamate 5-kinase [Gammaproteobacteria bacterium]